MVQGVARSRQGLPRYAVRWEAAPGRGPETAELPWAAPAHLQRRALKLHEPPALPQRPATAARALR